MFVTLLEYETLGYGSLVFMVSFSRSIIVQTLAAIRRVQHQDE